jgi:hypothetical protein
MNGASAPLALPLFRICGNTRLAGGGAARAFSRSLFVGPDRVPAVADRCRHRSTLPITVYSSQRRWRAERADDLIVRGPRSDPDPVTPRDPLDVDPDATFRKSASNSRSESAALQLLRRDARFQIPDVATKKLILEMMGAPPDVTYRTFDAVMTPTPVPALTVSTLADHVDQLIVIEVKATRKKIRNVALNGFFFGATEREYRLAEALGDRFRFAFVVLATDNDYGRPFFVLLTLDQLNKRTRTKRIQYQVNLGSRNESEGLEALFGAYDVITRPGERGVPSGEVHILGEE